MAVAVAVPLLSLCFQSVAKESWPRTGRLLWWGWENEHDR